MRAVSIGVDAERDGVTEPMRTTLGSLLHPAHRALERLVGEALAHVIEDRERARRMLLVVRLHRIEEFALFLRGKALFEEAEVHPGERRSVRAERMTTNEIPVRPWIDAGQADRETRIETFGCGGRVVFEERTDATIDELERRVVAEEAALLRMIDAFVGLIARDDACHLDHLGKSRLVQIGLAISPPEQARGTDEIELRLEARKATGIGIAEDEHFAKLVGRGGLAATMTLEHSTRLGDAAERAFEGGFVALPHDAIASRKHGKHMLAAQTAIEMQVQLGQRRPRRMNGRRGDRHAGSVAPSENKCMTSTCPHCHRTVPTGAAFCPYDGLALPRRSIAPPARKPQATQQSGAVLGGRYRIEGFVDKGATARVYLADDLLEQKKVAVKMFAPSVALKQEMRTRFLRGAAATRSLVHPHVVRVLDIGETDNGAPYVVLEALDGEPLGERLRRDESLDAPLALRIAREAAAGLQAAHAVGVIHRDVKPDNLFLVGPPGSDDVTVKVIDFGMAKVPRSTGSSAGFVLGTLEYMSPEQIVSETIDGRTDVYGLGVVMFKMFTGHLPFDVSIKEGTDLLGHQLFSPAPPPSWLDEGMDPMVERVILSAIRKRPENRYPTMEAMLADLERAAHLREGGPHGQKLVTEPDVFEPHTERGKEAERFLSARFKVPPTTKR